VTPARCTARVAAVVALVAIPVLAAVPAQASDKEGGGWGLGLGPTLGIFVGIPLGLFLLSVLLGTLPELLRGPRYRPGRDWNYPPVWFGGPPEPDEAVERARPEDDRRGGGASAEW
jgi:hypothetical protein